MIQLSFHSEFRSLSADCLPLAGNGDHYLQQILKYTITLNRSCFGSSFSYEGKQGRIVQI